jgi:tyrosyl-tRNA synthetase
MSMKPEEKVALIKRNTEEIVEESELLELFKAKKHPHAYIGFAPTGRLHAGYMIPIRKIVDFLDAGCEFTFLIADLHAFLDDNKTPWDLLDARFEYYKAGVSALLRAFGAPLERVRFVRGSDFELQKDYTLNIFHMVGQTTLNRAKRAAAEVVRFGDEPKVGGFVYPFLQIEDVYALGADICFGGIDQRGIYMLGRDLAPKMGRAKYACVFTPLLPGLSGAKMSASDPNSKIDVLDSSDEVARKVNKAHCPAGEKEGNGVLAFLEHVVFPHLRKQPLTIRRPEKFGGDLLFESYKSLESAFLSGSLHPADMKAALSEELNALLEPVRKEVSESLVKAAYP